MENFFPNNSTAIELPILHKIENLYKELYKINLKASKKHRFGILAKIENICMETLILIIKAILSKRYHKKEILEEIRIKTDILKRLIRISKDLLIIQEKDYLNMETNLQEISKMTNGWIKYLS